MTVITVSKDDSGMYSSIQSAVNSLYIQDETPVTIRIGKGVYREKIKISRSFVTLEAEPGEEVSIVWGDGSDTLDETGNMLGTFRTATVTVTGHDFTAKQITFQNDYGPGRGEGAHCGQAVAVSAECDRAFFCQCRFLGSQDTLYTGKAESAMPDWTPEKGYEHRQCYRDCYILGDIDFIFGGGTVLFDRCVIESADRNAEFTVPDIEGAFNGYVTAAATKEKTRFGYVFSQCRLISRARKGTVYLGRPWRESANVAFLNCQLGPHIHPAGWAVWTGTQRHRTCRFVEYRNRGDGAERLGSVFSRELDDTEAKEYEISNLLNEPDPWNPAEESE